MKETDVSGWSREELEAAYKQMAKNCAARGQSLACAKKKIDDLEKQLAGMDKDEVEQTIEEQKNRIAELNKELEDERATRKRAAAYAEELEATIREMRAEKVKEVRQEERVTLAETVIRVEGPRPEMMTIYFSGEDEDV